MQHLRQSNPLQLNLLRENSQNSFDSQTPLLMEPPFFLNQSINFAHNLANEYGIIRPMKIVKAIRRAAHTATKLMAVSLAALFLTGPVSFCLCDEDPDNCGESCHDCSESADEDCEHATIDVDDFTLSHNDDNIFNIDRLTDVTADFCSAPRLEARQISRPTAASPPFRNWAYISYSSRLNPLS